MKLFNYHTVPKSIQWGYPRDSKIAFFQLEPTKRPLFQKSKTLIKKSLSAKNPKRLNARRTLRNSLSTNFYHQCLTVFKRRYLEKVGETVRILASGIDGMLLTSRLSSSSVLAYRIISGGMAAMFVLLLSITSTFALHARNSRDNRPIILTEL